MEPGEFCNVVFVVVVDAIAVAAVGVIFVVDSLEEVMAGDSVRYAVILT